MIWAVVFAWTVGRSVSEEISARTAINGLDSKNFDSWWYRSIGRKAAPSGRIHAAGGIINHKMYVFGGQDSEDRLLNDLYFYDIRRGEWSGALERLVYDEDASIIDAIGTRPSARKLAAAAVVSDRYLYIIGGQQNRQLLTNDIHYFDTVTATFSGPLVPLGDKPAPHAAASAVAVHKLIYLFGGFDAFGAARNDLSIFNTTTMRWSLVSPSASWPSPRAYTPCTLISSHELYLVGGTNAQMNQDDVLFLSDAWILDIERLVWSRAKDFKTIALHGIVSAFSLDATPALYLLGGIERMHASAFPLQHHYSIQPKVPTDAWLDTSRQAAPLLPGRFGALTFSYDDGRLLFQFGGSSERINQARFHDDVIVLSRTILQRHADFLVDRNAESSSSFATNKVIYRPVA